MSVAEKGFSFLKEFKDFAMKGNVLDMAIGVVIGTAFGKIVSSLVSDVIMPLVGMIVGNVDFKDLAITLQEKTDTAEAVVLGYGAFIQTIVDFTIIAFAIFISMKLINNLKRSIIKEEKAEAKTEQFASSTSSDSTDSSEKAETESVDLAEIIAKNKESLNKLQAQATESISLLMESCTKAINDLQGKASAKINELMNDHNSSASNLMQKSAEAFNKLSEEKDAALDKVRQLIADDKAVIIHTDSELADKIEIKSQQFLNAHLQKKYPGRVKWMNENGDAQKGYDFLVEDNDFANVSHEYVIACKGILDDSKTFFMRQREWEACVKNARNYQIYVISKMNTAEPTLTIIDNLMDAIVSGKVVPCATANTKLKAGHVVLTIK
jgi:large conductance mechanosensitive channel